MNEREKLQTCLANSLPLKLAHHLLVSHTDKYSTKEIQIIFGLFLFIPMYSQASSSQMKSVTQPPALLAGWEESLGTYMQLVAIHRNSLYAI